MAIDTKKRREELENVITRVKWCMKRNRTKQGTIDLLSNLFKIEPATIRKVWEKLEDANQEIFRAHYRKLAALSDFKVKMCYQIKSKVLVVRYIERCIQNAMGEDDTIDFLAKHCDIDADLTRAAWEQLGRENRPLLAAYYKAVYAVGSSDDIESAIQANYNQYLAPQNGVLHQGMDID